MNIVTGILVYLVLWWVMFFTILPWGNRAPENPEVGFATSAPEKPRLWWKALITTGVTAVVWFLFYLTVDRAFDALL